VSSQPHAGVEPSPPTGCVRWGLTCEDVHTFDAAERWVATCDELRVDAISAPEGPTVFEDPLVKLTLLARASSSQLLGTIVTAPRLRHPAILANAFSTLQRLSGDRMFVGIGVGDLSLIQIGEPPAKVAELERYAAAVKALCAGETIEYDGKRLRIAHARPVPLWLGADGPRTLELAGRIADGVIVGQASHPDIVTFVRRNLAAGAAAAGRDVDDIMVWYMCRIDIADEPNAAVRTEGLDRYAARQANFLWRIAGSPRAQETRERILARKGLDLGEEIAHRLAAYGAEFSQEHAFTTNHNVDLLASHGLTDWAGDLLYLSGPVDHVVTRAKALMAAGAENFIVPLMGTSTMEQRIARAATIAPVFDTLRTPR